MRDRCPNRQRPCSGCLSTEIRLTAVLVTVGEFKCAWVLPRWEDEVEMFRKHRWPRRLPGPSSLLNRGDSTPIELFLEGVRKWEPGIRDLLGGGVIPQG